MKRSTLSLTLLFSILCASAAPRETLASNQSAQKLKTTQKKSIDIDYLLYLPDDYKKNSNKKYPLLLFLHGAGERGHDINKVRAHGPPKKIDEGESFPFIVASPQCPPDSWWDPDELLLLIETLEKEYRIDPSRIYVTGLSMGGYGTWELATKFPEKFAAIAPICGGGKAWLAARRLQDTPIWVFHGAKDQAVALSESQEMVDALKKKGHQNLKFTVYPEAAHDSWTESYNNPDLYSWLLSHKKS
ncbi:MAG: prolyl oligopeptidase family serine peptidase [Verrucomicrobiota bacterium]